MQRGLIESILQQGPQGSKVEKVSSAKSTENISIWYCHMNHVLSVLIPGMSAYAANIYVIVRVKWAWLQR